MRSEKKPHQELNSEGTAQKKKKQLSRVQSLQNSKQRDEIPVKPNRIYGNPVKLGEVRTKKPHQGRQSFGHWMNVIISDWHERRVERGGGGGEIGPRSAFAVTERRSTEPGEVLTIFMSEPPVYVWPIRF